MRIKMRDKCGHAMYYNVLADSNFTFLVGKYEDSFYYFQFGGVFSYSVSNYRFENEADVEKLIEDIFKEEAAGTLIYDVDKNIKALKIKLTNKEGWWNYEIFRIFDFGWRVNYDNYFNCRISCIRR